LQATNVSIRQNSVFSDGPRLQTAPCVTWSQRGSQGRSKTILPRQPIEAPIVPLVDRVRHSKKRSRESHVNRSEDSSSDDDEDQVFDNQHRSNIPLHDTRPLRKSIKIGHNDIGPVSNFN